MSKPSKHYTDYAFARPSVEITDEPRDYGQAGMLLRDYFAAAALTGMIAADTEYLESEEDHAKHAYKQADAMLKEREVQS